MKAAWPPQGLWPRCWWGLRHASSAAPKNHGERRSSWHSHTAHPPRIAGRPDGQCLHNGFLGLFTRGGRYAFGIPLECRSGRFRAGNHLIRCHRFHQVLSGQSRRRVSRSRRLAANPSLRLRPCPLPCCVPCPPCGLPAVDRPTHETKLTLKAKKALVFAAYYY